MHSFTKQSLYICFSNLKLRFCFSMTSPKVTLLRHARSIYNYKCDLHGKGLDIDWSRPLPDQEFCEKGPYNVMEMDSALSEDGLKQCERTAKQLESVNFDLILVSPMLRTLQTCELVFGTRNIPVKIQPLLSQAYRYSCDIVPSGTTKQKQSRFKHYDFSENYEPKFCYNMSEDKLNFLNKHLKWNKISEASQMDQQVNKLIRYHLLIESDAEVRERIQKMKLKLVKIMKQNNYKHVCLISHFHVLSCMRNKVFGKKGELLEYEKVENCKAYQYRLEELMEVM